MSESFHEIFASSESGLVCYNGYIMSPEEGVDVQPGRPPEQPTSRESALDYLVTDVEKSVRRGVYSSVEGAPDKTKAAVDKILEQLGEEYLVLRYAIPQEVATLPQIMDGFEAMAPEGSSAQQEAGSSPHYNFTMLFETIAQKSDKPVLAILENIDHIDERWRGDLLRIVRGLYNARAQEKSLRNLTWLLIGQKSPNELLPADGLTPYNIGEHFTID